MNRLRAVILIVLICSARIAARQAPPTDAPPHPPLAAASQQPAPAEYSQEPFVIESYETTARYENDGTGERDLRVRIRLQSDSGVQQLGELVFGFNSANEQMDVRSVRVRKTDSTVVAAAPEAVKEMTGTVARDAPVYTDYKEKHITVPSLHTGDTLEYEIVTHLVTPLAPNEFWYEHNFLEGAIVLDERLELNVPAGRTMSLQSPGFLYEKEDVSGRSIYRWKRATLAHTSDEEQARTKSKKSAPKPPAVQLTTFRSWEDVAKWYAKLEAGRTHPTPEIRTKTQELIQGRATELDKTQALYEYVSKNIRYVSLSFGLGRYQPHTAAEVFANQYGDCKDKHTLLAAMLEAANIPSDAVLIPLTRKLDTTLPSPSQFDHVITAVRSDKGLVWMDSTAEVAPFRLLAVALRNKSALLVPPDGDGKIVETPADPPFHSSQRVEIEGQVSDLGKLTAKMRYFLRGDNEFALRVAFRRTPQTRWKELAQTIATLDGVHGEVTAVKPSDPSDTQNPFELDLEFAQTNFLDWSSKKAKVTLPVVVIGVPDVPDDNTEPIQIGSPLDVTVNLKLTFPANFTVRAPVGIAVARDYAEYKSSYQSDKQMVEVHRVMNFKMRELPASRSGDYLAFARAVESDESQVLAVEAAATGAPAIPSTAKADELVEAGLAALNSGNPRAAIPLFQRVVELEPKHKQAWNDLGLAYLRIGKFDDAVAVFRKQIGVNPYDDHAYNYLGITFQLQQKFSDAADAFRKQIEVNPLDPVAHAALGGLYLEQHKYVEAVPELDKATVLTPDNAGLQVSLGNAYINTGEKEKALAAFEKGAELSQTPSVWNNIAYNLAEHRLELDKAKRYAESATAATAANLRNVELAHLTLDDLGAVVAMGAYWDTLGWVYFQEGNLDAAEHYIRAAWLLNQHGEVGDHLARVFEKRGLKDDAIRTYAMAIRAAHSVPETRSRCVALLGAEAKGSELEKLLNHAREELSALQTFPVGKLLNEKAEADFLVLLSPGEKEARVDAVQFVSGSEKLRPLASALRSLHFAGMFPDASPAKLIRRGTLLCSATTGDCTFVLLLPEDVRTVN
jgi:tetratricopeptide (TPR) repeat protein/transglutaminase-like putative cysteine protease